ncbi:hypothetical protein B0H11DRAFT_1923291 [Mycena galericulata]|nr:hypothetical protein B0H11DRAFT_1923291 [Mycena galericulata]
MTGVRWDSWNLKSSGSGDLFGSTNQTFDRRNAAYPTRLCTGPTSDADPSINNCSKTQRPPSLAPHATLTPPRKTTARLWSRYTDLARSSASATSRIFNTKLRVPGSQLVSDQIDAALRQNLSRARAELERLQRRRRDNSQSLPRVLARTGGETRARSRAQGRRGAFGGGRGGWCVPRSGARCLWGSSVELGSIDAGGCATRTRSEYNARAALRVTAKEGLMQYKNIAQNTSVQSIEVLITHFVALADQKVPEAQENAAAKVAVDVDDLEASETPESILLGAVSGDQRKDCTDQLLHVLETLKNNARLEVIYQQIAQQAFKLCLKHNRKAPPRGQVLASALAVPVPRLPPADDPATGAKTQLTALLSLARPPTRSALLAPPAISRLYQVLEVTFHPLSLCAEIALVLRELKAEEDYALYIPLLERAVLNRLIQLAQDHVHCVPTPQLRLRVLALPSTLAHSISRHPRVLAAGDAPLTLLFSTFYVQRPHDPAPPAPAAPRLAPATLLPLPDAGDAAAVHAKSVFWAELQILRPATLQKDADEDTITIYGAFHVPLPQSLSQPLTLQRNWTRSRGGKISRKPSSSIMKTVVQFEPTPDSSRSDLEPVQNEAATAESPCEVPCETRLPPNPARVPAATATRLAPGPAPNPRESSARRAARMHSERVQVEFEADDVCCVKAEIVSGKAVVKSKSDETPEMHIELKLRRLELDCKTPTPVADVDEKHTVLPQVLYDKNTTANLDTADEHTLRALLLGIMYRAPLRPSHALLEAAHGVGEGVRGGGLKSNIDLSSRLDRWIAFLRDEIAAKRAIVQAYQHVNMVYDANTYPIVELRNTTVGDGETRLQNKVDQCGATRRDSGRARGKWQWRAKENEQRREGCRGYNYRRYFKLGIEFKLGQEDSEEVEVEGGNTYTKTNNNPPQP